MPISLPKSLPSPALITFLLSLVLSFIARFFRETLNRDGMRYIDTARLFVEQGFSAAAASFDWPGYSILIGLFAQLTGLPLETAGHLLGALLLAGACSIIVKQVQLFMPQHGWLACLVVLSLPALNAWRDEILREDGYWMFILLAFWLASRRPHEARPLNAIGPLVSIGIASVFRVEALALYPALILWQLYALKDNRSVKQCFYLLALPSLIAILLAAALILDTADPDRLARYWRYFSPLQAYERFDIRADRMAKAALSHYAWDEANRVLAFGLIGLLITKFLTFQGILAIPLAAGLISSRRGGQSFQPFGWLFLSHLIVVLVFMFSMFFASDRYLAPLGILSIPLIVYGLSIIWSKFRKFRPIFFTILVISSLDNVISFNSEKTQYVDAGFWLKEHGITPPQAFIDDRRIAYYAGWAINKTPAHATTAQRENAYNNKDIVYFVLTQNQESEKWANSKSLEIAAHFASPNNEAVTIFKRK